MHRQPPAKHTPWLGLQLPPLTPAARGHVQHAAPPPLFSHYHHHHHPTNPWRAAGSEAWTADLGLPVERAWRPWYANTSEGSQVAGYVVAYKGLQYGGWRLGGGAVPGQGFAAG